MNKAFKLSSIAAALVLSSVLVGCGSSHDDNKNSDPVVNKKARDITVIDSAVSGATVSVEGSKLVDGAKVTGSDGIAGGVEYEETIEKPVFISVGGKTSTGLDAPKMNSVSDGTIITPYTTAISNGIDVKETFHLTANNEELLGDYTKSEDPNIAKVGVLLGRVLYCEGGIERANDNTTIKDILQDASVAATNTDDVIRAIGGKTSSIAKMIADFNSTVISGGAIEMEKQLVDVKCGAINPDPDPDPDPDNGNVVIPL